MMTRDIESAKYWAKKSKKLENAPITCNNIHLKGDAKWVLQNGRLL